MTKKPLLLCACLTFFQAIPSRAGEFGVNLYGLSYHFTRATSDGGSFNEFNPGFGAKYVFFQDRRGIGFAEAGIFSDSERNSAKYAAVGYGFKLLDSLLSVGITIWTVQKPYPEQQ